MNITIYLNGEIVARGTNMKKILNHVGKLFKQGHTDIIVSGGKIGSNRCLVHYLIFVDTYHSFHWNSLSIHLLSPILIPITLATPCHELHPVTPNKYKEKNPIDEHASDVYYSSYY